MGLYTGLETVELYAYNDWLAAYEPVLEPWSVSMEVHL